MRHWLSSALWFCAPFAVLLVLWAFLVPYFDVNPRLFPHLDSVVRDVSLEVPAGEFGSIVGPSGRGKTTLLDSWKQNATERSDKNI